jgi:hypothetical protein
MCHRRPNNVSTLKLLALLVTLLSKCRQIDRVQDDGDVRYEQVCGTTFRHVGSNVATHTDTSVLLNRLAEYHESTTMSPPLCDLFLSRS